MSSRAIHVEVMDETVAAVLREKTGAARLQIASGLFSSARRMLLNHVRSTRPGWSEDQIVREGNISARSASLRSPRQG